MVGAGIAGCGAAWSLDRAGFEVELFESAPVIGGNKVNANPRLGPDYHLPDGSPCAEAGTDLSAAGIVDDIDGEPRPQLGAYDIGCDESPFGPPPKMMTF